MKNTKIVRVAQWDGWCGACAAERPLVLTRTGRQRLLTWLTGAADDSRPLVLTCRLCGTGVDVPLERDDPPATAVEAPASEPTEGVELLPAAPETLTAAPVALGPPAADLTEGHRAVARALGGLLAQRSAAVAVAPATTVPDLVKTPALAPALPQQRTASSGGLAELQLLADGIDLLSTGRA